jgi:pimeloyl-ACP methyl ester carboxylesterase
LTGLSSTDVAAQAAPPKSPPAEWGPISINLEEIAYPYPVSYLNLRLYEQDVRIAYMDVAAVGPANGQTVMLLHGGSYYGWYWKAQIEALSKTGFRVVVEDRLGWGKSSKPILPYSISLHASNTAALLDHLGITEAAIVGHSIGGQMATRFAFLYPKRATHLVMINPIGLTEIALAAASGPFDGKVDVAPNLQAAYKRTRTEMSY